MDNKRKVLYEQLSQDYELGDFNSFSANLDDENKRKAFYDAVSQDYDLGDYDDFNSKIGSSVNLSTKPVAEVTPDFTSDRASLKEQVEGNNQKFAKMEDLPWMKPQGGKDGLVHSTDLVSRLNDTYKEGGMESFIHSDEDAKINDRYTPKKEEKAEDVWNNAANKFSLTERGSQLQSELANIQNEITNKYLDEFKNSDEYKAYAGKKYTSQAEVDEANKVINNLFSTKYGEAINNDLQPYQQAYNNEMLARYGVEVESGLNKVARKENAETIKGLREQLGLLQHENAQSLGAETSNSATFMPAAARIKSQQQSNPEQSRKTSNLHAAQMLIEDSENTIDGATNKEGFFGDLFKALGVKAGDVNNWTAGAAELLKNTQIGEAFEKAAKNQSLSRDEQLLLEAYTTNLATHFFNDKDLSLGYTAGMVTGESLPFIADFIFNPLSGAGKIIAKKMLTTALKRGISGNLVKFGGRLAADAIASTGMTLTSGMPSVMADTQRRLNEDYDYSFDDNGNMNVVKKGEVSLGEAFAKSFTTRAIENQSEMVFNAFGKWSPLNPIVKTIGDAMPDGAKGFMNRVRNSKAADWYREVKNNPTLKEIAERSQFHGLPSEYFEEVYNNFSNVALGEMSMEDALDLENNIETFVGLAPTSVVFGLIGLGGMAKERYMNRRNINRVTAVMNDEQKAMLKELMEMGKLNDNKDIAEFIKITMADKDLTPEQKRAEIEYAYEIAKQNAINEVAEAEVEDSINETNTFVDAVTNPSTGEYAEVDRWIVNEDGVRVPQHGYIVGWIGESPVFVPEGMENTEENRIVLKPTEWNPDTVERMDAEQVKALNEEMTRANAAQQAEMESKYAPEVLNAQMQQGVPFNTPTSQIVPVAPMPEGNGWIVEEYAFEGDGKVSKTPQVREFTNDEYRDMLQSQLDAQEQIAAEAADNVVQSESAQEGAVEGISTQNEGEAVSGTEEVAGEEVAAPAEVEEKTSVVPTKEDGSIDFVAYGKDNSFRALGDKYGEKMPNKVDVTAKAFAADLKKAEQKLAKAEEAVDNAPIGREAKFEEARDKAKAELEAVKREADFWAEMDADIKSAQARRESILNPQAELETTNEPMTADEFIAQQLAVGNIVLNKDSYKAETGFGDAEANAMNGGAKKLFSSNGMTIEEAGERLMEMDRENETNFFNQEDATAGRDALINFLGGVKSRKELNQFIANARAEQAKKDSEGLRNELEKQVVAAHYESLEDFVLQNEAAEMENPFMEDRAEEIMAIFAEEAAKYEQSLNNVENGQGTTNEVTEGSDSVLSSEQADNSGRVEEQQEPERVGDGVAEQSERAHAQSEEVVKKPQVYNVLEEAERIDAEEKRRRPLRARANEWAKALGVKVVFIERIEDAPTASIRAEIEAVHKNGQIAPGWVSGGNAYFFLPDLTDLSEVDKTYIHEVVAHKGLKEMLGEERFNELCDKVWAMMPQSAKDYFTKEYPIVKDKEGVEQQRAAADEYIAHLAEKENLTPEEKTIWDNIVKLFREMFDRALNGIIGKTQLTDEDISNLIKASYANLKSGANEGIVGEGTRFMVKKRKDQLKKAERFIEESLKGKRRNKVFTIELPQRVINRIKSVVGDVFDSHNLSANGLVHAKGNHGVNGEDIDEKSIPLRDEDFKLAPYIMIAPDKVERGSNGSDIRQSIRFTKYLSNGEAVVVEKEQKNSPDDMETITMWADLSSNVVDARLKRPRGTTSETVIISMDDAAKIRKDAENAIEEDENRKAKSRFRVIEDKNGRKSLVGLHNISEGKLRKAIKQGGLANPSMAVIDMDKQAHVDYGDITLIAPSSLIDKKTGKNIGTYTADAWTPIYPQVEKQMSKNGAKEYSKALEQVPSELRSKVRLYFNAYLEDGNTSDAMYYWFLQDTGKNPPLLTSKSEEYTDTELDAIEAISKAGYYSALNEEEKQRVLELYIEKQGGKEAFEKKIADRVETMKNNLQRTNIKEFIKKKVEQKLKAIEEYGYDYDQVSDFYSGAQSAINTRGKVDEWVTFRNAKDVVNNEGLQKEFDKWLSDKEEQFGVEEKLFVGYTNQGDRKYIPNTLENASKLMKKEGRAGATGLHGFNHFVATLAPNAGSLTQINKKKGNLSTQEEYDAFREKWGDVYHELAQQLQPNATGYADYGYYRLEEMPTVKNPKEYVEKEYGIDLSDEFMQKYNDFVSAIKNDFPARYFETKFERPVYLNEFAAAVVPQGTSEDIVSALKESGLPVEEYERGNNEARMAAVDKVASESDGIRFRTVYHGSGASFDKFDHSFMGTGEGNQSFGWGTYVTDSQGIGKQYAKVIGGEPVFTYKGMTKDEAYKKYPELQYLSFFMDRGDSAEEAISRRKSILNKVINTEGVDWFRKDMAEKSIEILDSLEPSEMKMTKNRHLYEVEIPDNDGTNYLSWEEPLTDEQKERIKNELVKTKEYKSYAERYGKELSEERVENWLSAKGGAGRVYRFLENFYEDSDNSAKSVSELLSDAGFVGMEYPANYYGGGNSHGDNNYVIFNEDDLQIVEHTRFRVANRNQEIFVSNAVKAVEGIKQEKATPQQWLAMIEKNGGLKAGEDKWLGLSDWLKASDAKTLTKDEVLNFINQNKIVIEEVHYEEGLVGANKDDFEEAFWTNYVDGTLQNVQIKDEDLAYSWYKEQTGKELKTDENGRLTDRSYRKIEDYANETVVNKQQINQVRMDYTTEGLVNNHEIALTVPTIEPWNQSDEIHFGDAGHGRAVVWMRFGETSIEDKELAEKSKILGSKEWWDKSEEERKAIMDELKELKQNSKPTRVLVIDEIQSKRHQEGREEGYRSSIVELDNEIEKAKKESKQAEEAYKEYYDSLFTKYSVSEYFGLNDEKVRGTLDELAKKRDESIDRVNKLKEEHKKLQGKKYSLVPDAPFEKNWSELAMKRMLRYAAENGFDKVAWTKGAQQAERYNIGGVVDRIEAYRYVDPTTGEVMDGEYQLFTYKTDGSTIHEASGVMNAERIHEVFGKELGSRIIEETEKTSGSGRAEISGDNLQIGGKGMKGFYDKMLPSFVNKYVKKWGTKVQDIELPALEESGQIMHSVDVTDAMKESVMEGQVMFRMTRAEVQKAVDEFTSKYNSKPVSVVSSEMTDEELEAAMPVSLAEDTREMISKGKFASYSPTADKIFIFADNNTPETLEDTLFHENLHGILTNKGIVDEFYNNIKDKNPMIVEEIAKEYKGADVAEEALVFTLAQGMVQGKFGFLNKYLSEESKDELFNTLKEFGYDYEQESERRRNGRTNAVGNQEGEGVRTSGNRNEAMDERAGRTAPEEGSVNGVEGRRPEESGKSQEGERSAESRKERAERLKKFFDQVADMGLDGVLGNKEYVIAMVDIYKSLPEEVRLDIANNALKHYGGNVAPAVSDYLNHNAEASVWDKVVAVIRDALRKIGFDIDLNANEAKYILWRSQKPLDLNNLLDVAEDIDKKFKLKVGEYDNSLADGGGTRFRVSGKLNVRDEYESAIKKGVFQAREAVQDSMLSLRKFQEMIEKASGEKIKDFENAWMHENRLSSVVQSQIHEMERKFYKPMMAAIKKLMVAASLEQEQVADYLMLKHGIERNREMAVRKALTDSEGKIDRTRLEQWYQDKRNVRSSSATPHLDTWRKQQEELDNIALMYGADMSRDYSGLTSMFGTDDLADSTQQAYDEVEALETAYPAETEALGKAIKAMTQNTLDESFGSGLMDRKVYEELSKDMYDYYIPLRGFEETTSDEVYAYLDQDRGAFNAPLKRAKGRSSKSDNPIAYLKSIAESGIMQGERNKMKQSFLNMVTNHPSDLVSVREGVWAIMNPATGEWEAVSPPHMPNNATPADVESAMEAWEAQMEHAASVDPNVKKIREADDVPYRVVGNRMDQHQVIVKRLGKSYTLTINGNPRLAMALNGLTNPSNRSNDGKVSAYVSSKIDALNRELSAWYTTRNPDFVASNFMRDTFYTNTIVRAKEGNKYANSFHKHYAKLLMPGKMISLFDKYENGTLDLTKAIERDFYEFMMNGGETGYSNLKDLEDIKKQISKELKGSRLEDVKKIAEKLDILNRAVENTARFAAYRTSRQSGRSISRSVFDAKEISVNFNKKGAGGTFFGMTGQTKLGNLAAMVGAGGRALYVFFNAAIQGTTNLMHVAKVNPKGTSAGISAMFLMGSVVPFLFAGDDDEEKSYYDIPEHVRRNHLIVPGAGDAWISIPLPIEYRIMYGMGELLTSWRAGHERGSDIARKMLNMTGQALPLNFLEEGLDAFIPSALSPVWQVYNNESWTGLPIYKDNEFNKNDPEYTKAYKNVDRTLYNFSKAMYEWTFDEQNQKEGVDLNPAVIESLAKGYFGGLATQLSNIFKTYEMVAGEREFDWRNIPVANRLFKTGDARTREKRITNEYFENIEKLEFLQSRERLLKKTKDGSAVPQEYKDGAEADLKIMKDSEVYKKYMEFKKAKKAADKIYKKRKEKDSPELEEKYYEALDKANKALD